MADVYPALAIGASCREKVTVDECDADTRVYRKPTLLPGEQVGSGLRIEEALTLEPADRGTADLLGECNQIGLGDPSGRQERRWPVRAIRARHEDAVGDLSPAHVRGG